MVHTNKAPRVFISYARKDGEEFACKLRERIENEEPEITQWQDRIKLTSQRDLAEIFNTPAYARWREFRESEDSRYVGLTMPRILMRLPYEPRPSPVSSFQMAEDAEENGYHFLWGNAARYLPEIAEIPRGVPSSRRPQ
jgi:predicted component of type VI protein secretion system